MATDKINIQYYKTRIGEFIIGSYLGKLCLLDYRYRKNRETIDKRIKAGLNADYFEQEDALIKVTKQQLNEFLEGERKVFDIPLMVVGSDFQKQVWQALLEIKYGETMSYLDLSRQMDKEKAIRAVAAANGANAISVIIPCHRIIGADGKLVGYAGGLDAKKRLLILEKQNALFHKQGTLDLW